jgi:SAM-dependent methyltransferase
MSLLKRKYKSYKDYLHHQSRKLDTGIRKKVKKFMPEHFSKSVNSFEKRIRKFKDQVDDGKILCLGARLGAEVVAFRNLGFLDTIGIDINPGKNNKYVIKGDFHNMEFDDKSIDIIYCNCIDHCWDLGLLSKEMDRILRDSGKLVLEIDHLTKNKKRNRDWIERYSKYESVLYDGIKDIEKGLKDFKIIFKSDSAHPKLKIVIFKKENCNNE